MCCLALRLPSQADREIESRICEDAVMAICNGGEDNWGVKTQFLCNRIQFPLIKSAAKGEAAMMKDCMGTHHMWTWEGVADGGGLAILNDLSNPAHFDHVRFLAFGAAVDPAQLLVDVASEHEPETAHESCVVVHLVLDLAAGAF